MNDKDRTSIHEAMEQQSISISKAGIVTSLQARCSVIAAANPIRGRYDPSLSFAHNVNLTEPILSRFDVMCVVRDTVDAIADEQLARSVVATHRCSHPDIGIDEQRRIADSVSDAPAVLSQRNERATFRDRDEDADDALERRDVLSQDMLKKYILYARRRCHPKIGNVEHDKITQLYAELRANCPRGGGLPLGVRHIEAIIRLAEAHAKMHLRDFVRADDVDMAIRVTLESFISAQKTAVARNLRSHFRKYITYKRDNNELIFFLLQNLVREQANYLKIRYGVEAPSSIEIAADELVGRAREFDLSPAELAAFYKSTTFEANHFSIRPSKNLIIKKFT
jgi:DNA replication licensing factor MCM2